jgi:cytochrome c6
LAEGEAPFLPQVVLNPAELFAKTCGGCHTGGGNVVNGGETLRAADLERNGLLSDEAALRTVVRLGKGKMPGYGEECAPRGACTFGARLSESDIERLSSYVLEQAKAGWPAP